MAIGDSLHSFQSEWLKKKRSLGSWLIVVGSLFTPMIILASRLMDHRKLAGLSMASTFWTALWRSSWESMAIFFLPMAAILVTSLITQIEYRNNAWKQVHALPLSSGAIFFSKLAVILVMMAQFVLLFDVAVYLSGVLPSLLLKDVPFPSSPVPVRTFLNDTGDYMIAALPIVLVQYLLSLRFKNFLVPVGMGFLAWVGALAALSWRYGYMIPYSYTMLTYLRDDPKRRVTIPISQLHWLAIGYAIVFTIAAYWLFVSKRQKG
jgi:lantibiotic transport system permease protein